MALNQIVEKAGREARFKLPDSLYALMPNNGYRRADRTRLYFTMTQSGFSLTAGSYYVDEDGRGVVFYRS